MYVGVQGIGTSQHELHFLLRHGVTHMDTQVDPDNLDRIAQQREEAAAEGVELEMMHIPMPESITFADDTRRDRDLDTLCTWVEAAGKAGLRGLNYNFTVVGYQRTPTATAAAVPSTAPSNSPNTTTTSHIPAAGSTATRFSRALRIF